MMSVDMPPIGKSLILALQHVFAMFGATILVPILVNAAGGETVLTIPVAMVTSGVGTLIYIVVPKRNHQFILEVHLLLLHQ